MSYFLTPLIIPLVSTATGIALQSMYQFSLVGIVTVIAIGSILTVYSAWKHYRNIIQLSLGILFIGIGACMLWIQNTSNKRLFNLLAEQPLSLIATVTDKGTWGERQRGTVLYVDVNDTYCHQTKTHQAHSYQLICYLRYPTSIHVGDTVALDAITIKKTFSHSHSGNPSYYDYLHKENILASLFITNKQCQILDRPRWSIRRWLWNARARCYQTIKRQITPKTAAYFGLIFLGNKEHDNIEGMRLTFNYWGLSHYLARAGLHIVLVIAIWTFLLSFIPIHIRFKNLFLIIMCMVYDCLSWTSIPFRRALYVFLAAKTASLITQRANTLHVLTLLCLGILLFNPMQLFFLDFQLTFALTFALTLSANVIRQSKKKQ